MTCPPSNLAEAPSAVAHVPVFLIAKLDYPIIVLWQGLRRADRLVKESRKAHHESAEETLLAISQFKRYLDGVEKALSWMSKKFSNREIAQGVGFATAGIHEALTYLGIVKKVIEKTERIVAKKNLVSINETDGLPRATGDLQ